jgi:hypothetical protein
MKLERPIGINKDARKEKLRGCYRKNINKLQSERGKTR